MRRFTPLVIAGALCIAATPAFGQRSGGPPPGGNHSDAGGPGGGGGNHSDNGGPGGGGGNHSDNGGPGGNGGNHSDNGGGNHSDNGGPGGDRAVVSAAIEEAVTAAQLQLVDELNSGRIGLTLASTSDASSVAAATSDLASVLEGGTDVAAVAQLTNALSRSGASPRLVAALAQSLQGLATAPAGTGPDGAPARVRTAASNFNALVSAASHDFLAHPPAEFLVLRATLAPLVQALGSGTGSQVTRG